MVCLFSTLTVAYLSVVVGARHSVLHLALYLPARVAVPPHVHLGKAANVAHAHHVHSEITEKVHNVLGLV